MPTILENYHTSFTPILSPITSGQQPFHISKLTPGNHSQFPSEYVLLDNYTEGRYLFFSQEYDASQTGPLSIGDVIPNFAEMRKLSCLVLIQTDSGGRIH